MNHWTDPLQHIACAEGIKDGRRYDTCTDWWRGTQRSDYMLWLLEAVAYPDDRKLRLLACRFIREIAVDTTRTVWDLLTDDRSRSAVAAAEMYAEGRATDGELEAAERAASDAASDAASAAASSATSSAEWEAAWEAVSAAAQTAACAAAWVAARDARDARGAAWAASAAAWAAVSAAECAVAMESARAQQADIIRDMIPATEIAPLFERYIQTLQGEDS